MRQNDQIFQPTVATFQIFGDSYAAFLRIDIREDLQDQSSLIEYYHSRFGGLLRRYKIMQK